MKSKTLFIVFILFTLTLLFPGLSLAGSVSHQTECKETVNIGNYSNVCCQYQCCAWDEEGGCTATCCVSSCNQYSCSGSWDEYRAETNECGIKILKRNCQSVCGPASNCCGCGHCQVQCSTPEVYKVCQPWQKSKRGCNVTKWGKIAPECKCDGSCLETPENPRLFDGEGEQADVDVRLPIKMEWDDVSYWKEAPDGPQFYKIRIEDTVEGTFIKKLDDSKYNPKEDKGPCFLKSDTTHHWHVKACCPDGISCGQESNWNFKTSFAPELISPDDPDWNGEEKIENISIPTTLDWCPVEEAESYNLQFYLIENEEEICHPCLENYGECTFLPINKLTQPEKELSSFIDEYKEFFTKDTVYKWGAVSCKDAFNLDCSDCGQKWSFSTQADITLLPPEARRPLDDPEGKTPIGFPVNLGWIKEGGMNSYIYEVNPDNITGTTTDTQVFLNHPTLKINTLYNWKIKSCWDFEAKKCEEFGKTYYFKTTGASPQNFSVDASIIPIELSWKKIGGVASYKYEVSKNKNFNDIISKGSIEDTELIFDYPTIIQNADYWWRIKTCAQRYGELCGNWSEVQSFKTFKLPTPINPSPEDHSIISTTQNHFFSWGSAPGARYYQYKIRYYESSPDETQEQCPKLLEEEIIKTLHLSTGDLRPLQCKGKYQWQVRACLDKDCTEAGEWNEPWYFTLTSEEAPKELQGRGLIPCGRTYNDPTTLWDETEQCQVKHIFVLFKNILDFFLWTIIPLFLIVLVIGTGLIFYFSFGGLTTLSKVKSLWKAAIIGFGIIFFAWTIVSFILTSFGYNVGIFGPWWKF